MADTRYKDADWNCDSCTKGSGKAETALLMDIRDELRTLNAVFRCHNFLAIPRKLDRIAKNTAKRRKPKKA